MPGEDAAPRMHLGLAHRSNGGGPRGVFGTVQSISSIGFGLMLLTVAIKHAFQIPAESIAIWLPV